MQTIILNDPFSMVGPRARPRQLLHDNARSSACWLTFCPFAEGCPVGARCLPVGCALPVGNGQRAAGARCLPVARWCALRARWLRVARWQRVRSERCLPVDRVSPVGRALPVGPRFHGQLTLQRASLRVHLAVSLVSAWQGLWFWKSPLQRRNRLPAQPVRLHGCLCYVCKGLSRLATTKVTFEDVIYFTIISDTSVIWNKSETKTDQKFLFEIFSIYLIIIPVISLNKLMQQKFFVKNVGIQHINIQPAKSNQRRHTF